MKFWLFFGQFCVFSLLLLGQQGQLAAQQEEDTFSPARVALWLDNFRTQAVAEGVSPDFFDRAFVNFKPVRRAVKASKNQPEFTIQPGAYVSKLVSAVRLEKGKKLLHEHAAILERLERFYGVDRHIIVAIWGIETNYGTTMGTHNVVHALASLAIEGRRKKFAENQLLALLSVLEKDNLDINQSGSWAGAMGQMQFIPTTYKNYARDTDGDGKRDIWNSLEDSLGSAAYYLKRHGWVAGLPWGIEVQTPADFSFEENEKAVQTKEQQKQPLADWLEEGYIPAYGADARHEVWQDKEARLVKAAPHTPAFLVTKNFDALLRYNNATLYGLAVGRLADRLRGAPLTKTAWLKEPLTQWTKAELHEIQTSLYGLGFDAGEPDGVLGQKTRTAFKAWQTREGIQPSTMTRPLAARLNKQATTLTSNEIQTLQAQLTLLGFDAGIADGLMGQKTRTALSAFQSAAGFVIDGTPSHAMLIALREKTKAQEEQNDSTPETGSSTSGN